jgi:hypothetical protein
MIDIAAIVFIYCTLERSFGMSFSLKIIIPLSILIYTHEITLKLLLSNNNKDAKPGPKEDKGTVLSSPPNPDQVG